MRHSIPTPQEKIPYLYITGMGFSGSTLLAFLLNTHPDIISIAEVAGPIPRMENETYRCSCGAILPQCPFFGELERQINHLGSAFSLTNWQTRFQASDRRWLDILLTRPLRTVLLERIRDRLVGLWPHYKPTISVINRRTVHLAHAALAISGKKVFVDAQKDPIRIKFLQDIEQLDLKVVHLVRDVRAGVASIMKNYRTQDVAWATRIWCRRNMDADQASRYVDSHQWLRLRYTDLCANPQDSIDRLADFMGVQRAPVPNDFYAGEHHIIGNRMRMQDTGAVQEDMSWKDRLTEHDLSIIARNGGAVNRYFGYDFP